MFHVSKFVWVDFLSWIYCGSGYLAHFRLLLDSDPGLWKPIFDFFLLFFHLNIYYTLKIMWVQFLYWIKCGSASRSILTAFRLGLKFGKSIYFSFFFRRFPGIYLTLKLVSKNGLDWVWNFSFLLLFRNLGWRTFDLGFSVGAAISLTFDCFSILTRVSEKHISTFIRLFFRLFHFF